MFTFIIKDDKAAAEITVTRILMTVAGIAALAYPGQQYYFISVGCSAFLFLASYFVKTIVAKSKIDLFLLLLLAAVILFIATHSFFYAAGLFLYGIVLKFLRRKAIIEVSQKGIRIKKLFADTLEPWEVFSNIVLKDGLLTLDFLNNKLLQLSIEEQSVPVDDSAFNEFCRQHLG